MIQTLLPVTTAADGKSAPRRHVFMFQPRFVPLILDGTKTSTIRLPRKRVVDVGDILDLRTWTGRPYASKQRKLREVVCLSVLSIEIDESWEVWLHGNKRLEKKERAALARGEGFYSPMDMLTWFRDTHEIPFRGTLYRWEVRLCKDPLRRCHANAPHAACPERAARPTPPKPTIAGCASVTVSTPPSACSSGMPGCVPSSAKPSAGPPMRPPPPASWPSAPTKSW